MINTNELWQYIVEFFTTDRPRKIVALVLAVIFYLIISSSTGQEHTLTDVPVKLILPETLVNMDSTPPTFAKIIVRGGNIISPSELKIEAVVKEENYKSGTPYTLKFKNSDIKAPFGTTIVAIEPQVFDLTLESRISKKVPVEAVFSGQDEMNKDYRISKISFSPAQITVSGTESLLKDITSVSTEPIPLYGNATESFEYKATLASRSNVTLSPAEVNSYIEITKENEIKTVEAVPIALLLTPELEKKFTAELLSSTNVTVTLYGPRGKLALFQDNTLRAYADLTALNAPGTYTVNVYCRQPVDSELNINSIYPKQVQLKLTLK